MNAKLISRFYYIQCNSLAHDELASSCAHAKQPEWMALSLRDILWWRFQTCQFSGGDVAEVFCRPPSRIEQVTGA